MTPGTLANGVPEWVDPRRLEYNQGNWNYLKASELAPKVGLQSRPLVLDRATSCLFWEEIAAILYETQHLEAGRVHVHQRQDP
jgi:hypothetical protein